MFAHHSPHAFVIHGEPKDTAITQHTGRITWNPTAVTLDQIKRHTTVQAVEFLTRSFPVVVWNAAALEGNPCTLEEAQEIMSGTRPAHVSVFDADQILALADGYTLMLNAVQNGTFGLTKAFSDRVHSVVARHEAIESGHFRGEGSVTGGGTVRLSAGGTVPGDPAGDNCAQLRADYETLLADLEQIEDPRLKALVYIASATRSQFYFDGNKRTSRIMGTGALLAAGYPPVNIPVNRQNELNEVLDELFRRDDATSFITFLVSCILA